MKNYTKRATMCFVLFLLVVSCAKEDLPMSNEETNTSNLTKKIVKDHGFAENDMVLYWNKKTEIILGAPGPQPHRARYFAMIQIAVHDALNNIKPKYQRYALLNERTQFADPDAAVASATYWAIKGLNRQGVFAADLETWYTESLATIPDGESENLGIALGKKAADAIIANRDNDGLKQVILFTSLLPNGVNPGEYRSTLTALNWIPQSTVSLTRNVPNWGTVMQPYVIESNDQFRPGGPYAVTSNEYTTDFNEVKTKGARVGGIRSADEEKAGKF